MGSDYLEYWDWTEHKSTCGYVYLTHCGIIGDTSSGDFFCISLERDVNALSCGSKQVRVKDIKSAKHGQHGMHIFGLLLS